MHFLFACPPLASALIAKCLEALELLGCTCERSQSARTPESALRTCRAFVIPIGCNKELVNKFSGRFSALAPTSLHEFVTFCSATAFVCNVHDLTDNPPPGARSMNQMHIVMSECSCALIRVVIAKLLRWGHHPLGVDLGNDENGKYLLSLGLGNFYGEFHMCLTMGVFSSHFYLKCALSQK